MNRRCEESSPSKGHLISPFGDQDLTHNTVESKYQWQLEKVPIKKISTRRYEKNKKSTSSRGANPVPYRLIPRTSPRACLKAVPKAIALSCKIELSGLEERRLENSDITYLQCDDHQSIDHPCKSLSSRSRHAWQEQCTSRNMSENNISPENGLNLHDQGNRFL
jgi:hypothetical protein